MVELDLAPVDLVVHSLEVLDLSLLVGLDGNDDVLSISLVFLLEHEVLLGFPKRCLSSWAGLGSPGWYLPWGSRSGLGWR